MHPTSARAPRPGLHGVLGAVLFGLIAVLALLGFFWTPYDPVSIDLSAQLAPPSLHHLFGTDQFGRDVLSRAMTGAHVSLAIALVTVTLAVTGGTIVGLIAGYARGWVDRAAMTATDAVLAFPGMLLALGITAVTGAGARGIVIALSIAYLPAVVRMVRGTVLSLREKEYVEASRMIGNSNTYTILRHVLPNAIAPIAVLATSMFGWVLLAESALSFLGVGIAPPDPSWGNMLAESRPYLEQASWLGIVPGAFIAVALLGVNLLGDHLRDRLDPRQPQ